MWTDVQQLSVVNPIEDHQKKMKSATTRQFSDMVVPCTGDAQQVAITIEIVQEKIKNIFILIEVFIISIQINIAFF